jgi:hypothetical protein
MVRQWSVKIESRSFSTAQIVYTVGHAPPPIVETRRKIGNVVGTLRGQAYLPIRSPAEWYFGKSATKAIITFFSGKFF